MYTSLLIVKKLSYAWMYYPNSLTTGFAISKGYFSADEATNLFQIVEQGKTKRPEVLLQNITVKDEFSGGATLSFSNFTDLQQQLVIMGCPLSVDLIGGGVINPEDNVFLVKPGYTAALNVITIKKDWIWKLLGVTYTNPAAINFTIPYAAFGKTRIEYLIPNNTNGFTRVIGLESEGVVVEPQIPDNGLYALRYTVNDNVIMVDDGYAVDSAKIATNSLLFYKDATLNRQKKNKIERLISSLKLTGTYNSASNYWIARLNTPTAAGFTLSIGTTDPAVSTGSILNAAVITRGAGSAIQDYLLTGTTNSGVVSLINITINWSNWDAADPDFIIQGGNATELVSTIDKYSLVYTDGSPLGRVRMVRGVDGLVSETELAPDIANNNYYQKQRSGSNFFAKTASLNASNKYKIERFILKFEVLKGFDIAYDYWIRTFDASVNNSITLAFGSNNPAATNSYMAFDQTITYRGKLIDTYDIPPFVPIYSLQITVDWSEFLSGDTQFRVNGGTILTGLLKKSIGGSITQVYDINSYVTVQNVLNADLTQTNPLTALNANITIAQQSDGLRYKLDVPSGTNVNFAASTTDRFSIDKTRMYAAYIDYTVLEFNGNESETSNPDYFSISITRLGLGGSGSFAIEQKKGRVQGVVLIPIASNADVSNQYRISLISRNNKNTVGLVLDAVIHNLFIVDLGLPDSFLATKTPENLASLFTSSGFFGEKLSIAKNSWSTVVKNNVLANKKAVFFGDSVTLTNSFQPAVCQNFGMIYSVDELKTGLNGYPPTAIGGTRLVPVVVPGQTYWGPGMSIYMRGLQGLNYNPDIIFLLCGFNDIDLNARYVPEQPPIANYGIDDAPYIGPEVNLIDNPTALVPSFGASLKGLVVQFMQNRPQAKIIMSTLYIQPIGSVNVKASWRARNDVIRSVSRLYGIPLIDLEYNANINEYNYLTYMKNEASPIHPNRVGGERLAQVYIATI